MKISNRRFAPLFIAVVSLLAVHVPASHAHDMWVTMQDYVTAKSKPASLSVASAHHFPQKNDELMPCDRVDKAVLVAPDGRELQVQPEGDKAFKSKTPLEAQGTYIAVVTPQNGFFSKTTEGYQRGKSKKDLKEVIECRYSEKFGKAVFTVDTPGGDSFSRPLGLKAEIIPLKDPATLKEGDLLPVKILIEGQPARTYVYSTYAGFSDQANTYAYTTLTDKEGVARIRILKAGTWLLLAKQESPYPEATVCDKLSYAASLTFQVR